MTTKLIPKLAVIAQLNEQMTAYKEVVYVNNPDLDEIREDCIKIMDAAFSEHMGTCAPAEYFEFPESPVSMFGTVEDYKLECVDIYHGRFKRLMLEGER